MKRLNIGSGANKIPGYVNIDSEKSCKPDLVLDFVRHNLPYKVESIDEILFFHCIEHIPKFRHPRLLLEFARVLKKGGKIYISYPNFTECAKRLVENTGGLRKFWEATIYGRQLYPSDYHVCAINTDELTNTLYECGFKNIIAIPEPDESYNTVVMAIKGSSPLPTYETVIAQDLQSMKVVSK